MKTADPVPGYDKVILSSLHTHAMHTLAQLIDKTSWADVLEQIKTPFTNRQESIQIVCVLNIEGMLCFILARMFYIYILYIFI